MNASGVLVLGGAGFVGRHLAAALAPRGVRTVVPTRRLACAHPLLPLPNVELVEADVHDGEALTRLLRGCSAVVNLVGILHSRRGRRSERGPNDYGPDFAKAHVELPQALVAACRAAGVRRLVHMSALGADASAPSEYLRSRGIGEHAVLAADDLDVTVFRPSVIFGPDDRFLNMFAQLARLSPILLLASPEAKFQPVYVGDVAAAVVASLERHDAAGKRYDLCGPRVYTLQALVEFACATAGRRRIVWGLGKTLSVLQARVLEALPGQLLTRDNLRSMRVPSVCDAPFPFGIVPQALEALAPDWLSGARALGARRRAHVHP